MTYIKAQTKSNCYLDGSLQALAYSIMVNARKEFKISFPDTITVFSKGTVSWYDDEKEWRRLQKESTALVMKNPKIADRCRKNLFNGAKVFDKFLRKLAKTDLPMLNNKQLWKIYSDYLKHYEKLYVWGEPLAHYVREDLEEYLIDYLKGKNKDLALLCLPDYIHFTKREHIDLLKLAVKANEQNLAKLIKQHTEKYFWIPYDYGVTTWDEKHFMREYRKIKDPKKELAKIKKEFSDLKKQQKELIKELKIDKKHQQLIEAQRTFAIMMDYKKEVFTKAHYVFKDMLKELSKRLNLTLNQTKIMLNKEIEESILKNKKPDKKELDKRIAFSVAILGQKGVYMYYTGKKAKDVYNREVKSKIIKAQKLKGLPVSKGKYIGKVRVILDAKKINELKRGEILVTYMTSPDYTIAMRKCGAIITDEGGLTSHAAIVAREMRKPCIIGTKIATKVLKDGMTVEVDADKGIVKIK